MNDPWRCRIVVSRKQAAPISATIDWLLAAYALGMDTDILQVGTPGAAGREVQEGSAMRS